MLKRLGVWLGVLIAAAPLWAGELEGVVEIHSALGRRPRGKQQRIPGQQNGALYQAPARLTTPCDEVTNVVIYLLDTPGGPNKAAHYKMNQKNRQFSPYILPVMQGSSVDFVNGDLIFHSVYSQCECGPPFHLPEFPQGESRTVTFDQPGDVELFCAIHSEMNAHVLVLDTGYFTMPDAEHKFRLQGVPAGKRILKAWHPLLKNPVTKIVEVPANGSLRVDLNL